MDRANEGKRESDLDLGPGASNSNQTENPLKRMKPTKLMDDPSAHLTHHDLESLVDPDPTGPFLHHVSQSHDGKKNSGVLDRVVVMERRKPSFGEIKAMSIPELKQELNKLNLDTDEEKEVLMSRLIDALGLGKTFLCPWEGCDGAFDEPAAMESHIKTDHMSLSDDKVIALPSADLPMPVVPSATQQIVQIITDKHPQPKDVKRNSMDAVLPDVEQQKERQKINMLQRKRNAVARKIYKNLGCSNGIHSFQFEHKFRQSHLFDSVFDAVPTEAKDDKGTKIKVYTTKQQIQDQFGKQWVDKIFSLRYGSEVVNTTLECPLIVELDPNQRELRISGKYTAHQKQLRNSRPTSDRVAAVGMGPAGKRPPGAAEWKSRVVRLW